jgi:hypothetical protein
MEENTLDDIFQVKLAEQIDALAGAEVTLEDLAYDMDSGSVDYYGDTDEIRKQAKAVNEIRSVLRELLKRMQVQG